MTINLSAEEVTELLVAASEIDQGGASHALMRDRKGRTLAMYRDTHQAPPLDEGTDWWVGPILLLVLIVVVLGVVTIARGIVGLLF